MAWVNETHPDNREAGFAVTWTSDNTSRCVLEMASGYVNQHIFDPDVAVLDIFRWNAPLTFLTHTHGRILINLGSPKKINKIRIRFGSGDGWSAGIICPTFYLLANHVGGSTVSGYSRLGTYSLFPTQHDNGHLYRDYYIENDVSYQYFMLQWPGGYIQPGYYTPWIQGFDFFSGTFTDAIEEAQMTDYVEYQSSSNPTSAYLNNHLAVNAFDSNFSTEYTSDHNTYLLHDIGERHVVNFVSVLTFLPTSNAQTYAPHVSVQGSNDAINFMPLFSGLFNARFVPRSSDTATYEHRFDLRGISTEPFRYYRVQFQANSNDDSIRLASIKLAHLGYWAVMDETLPPRYISHSSTWPMAICDREPLECSGAIGAVTSSEDGEGFYLNRIYREPLEAEGFCGAIGGEYDWESEDFYIEREISAQAFISPVADFPMLVRDMNGLAGFGRQGNGAITIRHTVEGSTGEFALMDDGVRSRYEMEGHCGTLGEMSRRLAMSGFAQPGNNSSAVLFREALSMSALAGAVAGGTRTVEMSATALQHLFASLASSLPARTALATAVVEGIGWGDCILHSRQMDAEAVVSLFSNGSMTVPARWAEGQATAGDTATAGLILSTYTISAQAVVDALASAHFLRTNYRMTGKTRGSRFDTYLLKYEAPK